ncbi:MAG: hypothetical protein MRY83_01685 [Flavobacteriales bacterium]|nr:hypothetical protein [Flavobacteriales bacterium]
MKLEKVKFPLKDLDKNGLIGPEDGKVSIDYVFCIPSEKQYQDQVSQISADIKIDPNNSFFCKKKNQIACFGNTGNRTFKKTLRKLNNLDFVETIESVDWE